MFVHDGAIGFNRGLLNCRLRLLLVPMAARLSLLRVTVYAWTRDHRSLQELDLVLKCHDLNMHLVKCLTA